MRYLLKVAGLIVRNLIDDSGAPISPGSTIPSTIRRTEFVR
jgi:hypothetical protein